MSRHVKPCHSRAAGAEIVYNVHLFTCNFSFLLHANPLSRCFSFMARASKSHSLTSHSTDFALLFSFLSLFSYRFLLLFSCGGVNAHILIYDEKKR